MGYRIYNLKSSGYGQKSSVDEFEEAAMMAKEGLKMAKEGVSMICEISEEMADEFGFRERRGGGQSSYRSNYGNREEWDDDEGMMMRERRRRDSRGRYM